MSLKMSKRDRFLIGLIVVCGISYVLYTYVYSPLFSDLRAVSEEVEQKTLGKKDIDSLNRILKDRESEMTAKQSSFDLLSSKLIPSEGVDPEDFLVYVGDVSDESGLVITSIEKLDSVSISEYSYRRYKINVYGEYKSMIILANSLYRLADSTYVEEVEIKEKFILPMEMYLKDRTAIKMPFDWVSSSVDHLETFLNIDQLKFDETVSKNDVKRKTEMHVVVRFLEQVR